MHSAPMTVRKNGAETRRAMAMPPSRPATCTAHRAGSSSQSTWPPSMLPTLPENEVAIW